MELIMILVMVLRIRVMMGIAILEHLAKFLMGTNAIVMITELIMRGHDVQGSLFVILPPPGRPLKIRVFHPHQLKIRFFHYHQLKIRFAVSPTENLVFLFSPTVLPRSQV